MESPEYLRMSLAAAMTLKFKKGLFYRNAKSPCLNVLLTYDDGCRGNCSYCGLSMKRPGTYSDKSFIRVGWDAYKLDEIINNISKNKDSISRICISMITNIKSIKDTIELSMLFKKNFDIPISLLITPTILNKDHLLEFKEAGADWIGVAVDCATEEIFEKYRGKSVRGPHSWDKYWKCFEEAIPIFGRDRVGVHLIVGIGETEKEIIDVIQKVKNNRGFTHLFSFFPEADSMLAKLQPPEISNYRRIQLARYLIDEGLSSVDKFKFDDSGRLININMQKNNLVSYIESGKPFLTSGCPDKDGNVSCNRPFSNSKPSEEIRNFPFLPDADDIKIIKQELFDLINS